MKTSNRACRQCREGKRKCHHTGEDGCSPCIKRDLQCSLIRRPRVLPELRPDVEHLYGNPGSSTVARTEQAGYETTKDALASLSQETVEDLVDLYVRYIHDKPHSLFHVPTLKADVSSGNIDRGLLCSILALTARFSPSHEIRQLGPKLSEQAKSILKAGLETVSLSRIQAWVVLGNVCGADFDSAAESLYFGIAIRSAHILDLSKHNPEDGAVTRETRSRTWWSLYMLDRWSAAGLGLPRQLGERQESQQLPLDEYAFHNMAVDQEIWDSTASPGLWAYMILLAELFGPIQDLNRLVATQTASEQYALSTVEQLWSTLQDWQSGLPDNIRLNSESLSYHKARGQGRTFVALHLGYYHYAILLFFQFLDQSNSSVAVTQYAELCRQHASGFSDLLRTSYEIGECEAMYNIVGHMAVVSSSVLIHTLLFGNDDQLEPAKARLESNFTILMKLKAWWPRVGQIADRLFHFQRACLRSVDNHTHKVDRWMVKFLLEHAALLGNKDDDARCESTSPQDLALAGDSRHSQLSQRGQVTRQALSGLRS